MMNNENEARADRGRRAEAALKEFLTPAFDVVHTEYMSRMAQIAAKEPWEASKITKLATACRVVREVEAQVNALIADGEVADREMDRARKIAAIPSEKRKILGIGLPG